MESNSDVRLRDLKPLSTAEEQLIAACKVGHPLILGNEVPESPTDQNTIRAALIRHLLLGGCQDAPAHAKGVRIVGAYIQGELDFEYGVTDQALLLHLCNISADMNFSDSHMRALLLQGAQVQSVWAARAKFQKNVHMIDGFCAKGNVVFRGAEIGGQLGCDAGRFEGDFDCNGLYVGGSVFLCSGFRAKRSVTLIGAEIGGQLDCGDGLFDQGLDLQDFRVASAFLWRNVKCSGRVVLAQASVSVLADDLDSWPEDMTLYMNGFTYKTIESLDMDVRGRIDWVTKSKGLNDIEGFYEPHPYRQLAKVYEGIGDRRSAAAVGIASEDHYWAYERERVFPENNGSFASGLRAIKQGLRCKFALYQKALVGYGHAPVRALFWGLGCIAVAIVFYHCAYVAGAMVPNSDIILTSPDWRLVADVAAHKHPAEIWMNTPAGKDYETFSAIGYGIDLFIPLDALGQEKAWAPSYERGPWGVAGFYLRWVIQFSGWVITAVGAATLTGLIGRKRG